MSASSHRSNREAGYNSESSCLLRTHWVIAATVSSLEYSPTLARPLNQRILGSIAVHRQRHILAHEILPAMPVSGNEDGCVWMARARDRNTGTIPPASGLMLKRLHNSHRLLQYTCSARMQSSRHEVSTCYHCSARTRACTFPIHSAPLSRQEYTFCLNALDLMVLASSRHLGQPLSWPSKDFSSYVKMMSLLPSNLETSSVP